MLPKTETYIFLMYEEDFIDMKIKFQKFDFISKLIDNITYQGDKYNLYYINSDQLLLMTYAMGVTTIDGQIKKNKFTGIGNEFPAIIKQLFDRHIKSAGGSEQ